MQVDIHPTELHHSFSPSLPLPHLHCHTAERCDHLPTDLLLSRVSDRGGVRTPFQTWHFPQIKPDDTASPPPCVKLHMFADLWQQHARLGWLTGGFTPITGCLKYLRQDVDLEKVIFIIIDVIIHKESKGSVFYSFRNKKDAHHDKESDNSLTALLIMLILIWAAKLVSTPVLGPWKTFDQMLS